MNSIPLHSVYSASGSKRWLACPASIRMSKYKDNETNPAAELGTAAHELGEFCLRQGLNTHECLGLTFNKHVVDEEMVDAVQLYVLYIRDICTKYNVNPMLEVRVVMTSIRSDVYGTSDCVIIIGDWLFVIDYKHGYGVVEVENNSQAIFYAIATMDTFGLWDKIKHVRTAIVQPRADHIEGSIRDFDYTVDVMRQWVNVFANAIRIAESGAKPVAGDHCLYCPARATCMARMIRTIELAYNTEPFEEASTEQIYILFKEANIIKKHLDAVGEKMLELARKGEKFDGYKLVKAAKRYKCSDEEKFIEAAEKQGVKREQLLDVKLKSMSNCKRVVKQELIENFFSKGDAATSLVPMHDNRPAVSVCSAVGVFEPIEPLRPSAVGIFEGIK